MGVCCIPAGVGESGTLWALRVVGNSPVVVVKETASLGCCVKLGKRTRDGDSTAVVVGIVAAVEGNNWETGTGTLLVENWRLEALRQRFQLPNA
jgi:hypothetical protein